MVACSSSTSTSFAGWPGDVFKAAVEVAYPLADCWISEGHFGAGPLAVQRSRSPARSGLLLPVSGRLGYG
jgi:hypothetical protein